MKTSEENPFPWFFHLPETVPVLGSGLLPVFKDSNVASVWWLFHITAPSNSPLLSCSAFKGLYDCNEISWTSQDHFPIFSNLNSICNHYSTLPYNVRYTHVLGIKAWISFRVIIILSQEDDEWMEEKKERRGKVLQNLDNFKTRR